MQQTAAAVPGLLLLPVQPAAATAEPGRSATGGRAGVSFSTDMAKLVADQRSRFVTLNPHQLAGQVANLEFWLAQARHAAAALDGYGVRFVRMGAARERYVAAHGTRVSEVGPAGVTARKPPAPRRIPDRELPKARRALGGTARRLLDRCRNEGLISEPPYSAVLDRLDIE